MCARAWVCACVLACVRVCVCVCVCVREREKERERERERERETHNNSCKCEIERDRERENLGHTRPACLDAHFFSRYFKPRYRFQRDNIQPLQQFFTVCWFYTGRSSRVHLQSLSTSSVTANKGLTSLQTSSATQSKHNAAINVVTERATHETRHLSVHHERTGGS